MARIAWSEPAVADLLAIADYIAVENPAAASALVRRVYRHIGQLEEFPQSGGSIPELGADSRYGQIVEPPCRVFYRVQGEIVLILHIMRSEQILRPGLLSREEPPESV